MKGKRIAVIGQNRYEWEIAYLSKEGNREFIDSKINSEEMSIMLFTSGTTSTSKVVCLSHKNICSNLMDLASILDVNSEDALLSVLPVHHVFECTVGFLLGLYFHKWGS